MSAESELAPKITIRRGAALMLWTGTTGASTPIRGIRNLGRQRPRCHHRIRSHAGSGRHATTGVLTTAPLMASTRPKSPGSLCFSPGRGWRRPPVATPSTVGIAISRPSYGRRIESEPAAGLIRMKFGGSHDCTIINGDQYPTAGLANPPRSCRLDASWDAGLAQRRYNRRGATSPERGRLGWTAADRRTRSSRRGSA